MTDYPAFTLFEGFNAPFPFAVSLNAEETLWHHIEKWQAEHMLQGLKLPPLYHEWALIEAILNPLLTTKFSLTSLGTAELRFSIGSNQTTAMIGKVPYVKLLNEYYSKEIKNALAITRDHNFKSLGNSMEICTRYFMSLHYAHMRELSFAPLEESRASFRAVFGDKCSLVQLLKDIKELKTGATLAAFIPEKHGQEVLLKHLSGAEGLLSQRELKDPLPTYRILEAGTPDKESLHAFEQYIRSYALPEQVKGFEKEFKELYLSASSAEKAAYHNKQDSTYSVACKIPRSGGIWFYVNPIDLKNYTKQLTGSIKLPHLPIYTIADLPGITTHSHKFLNVASFEAVQKHYELTVQEVSLMSNCASYAVRP